jgi:hypothetical protein
MVKIRVKLNKPGLNAFMNSEGVQALLQEEGERVAARAASMTKPRAVNQNNPDYVVRVVLGNRKAICFIWAANVNSLLAEIHDRALSKAAGQ